MTLLPAQMPGTVVEVEEDIPGGCHGSLRVRRGYCLQLEDVEGGANVGMLLYNPENLLERYNAPDTLKCQHTFKLTRGHCLYSDMGRIFCGVVQDDLGWHETVCGNSTEALVEQRWGRRNYQHYRNQWQQSGYKSFLVELAKYGLGKRDMAANVNFFSKVIAADDGQLRYVSDHSAAGSRLTLRFEMDTLVVLHTCPHPLNPAAEYPRRPIRYRLYPAAPVAADDVCRNSRIENRHGYENNRRYHLGACGAPGHD